MARIKVPDAEGQIIVYDGNVPRTYRVAAGVIVVDDAHVAAVLASVAGSELAPEAPAKEK
jgi:hypothetical protein